MEGGVTNDCFVAEQVEIIGCPLVFDTAVGILETSHPEYVVTPDEPFEPVEVESSPISGLVFLSALDLEPERALDMASAVAEVSQH